MGKMVLMTAAIKISRKTAAVEHHSFLISNTLLLSSSVFSFKRNKKREDERSGEVWLEIKKKRPWTGYPSRGARKNWEQSGGARGITVLWSSIPFPSLASSSCGSLAREERERNSQAISLHVEHESLSFQSDSVLNWGIMAWSSISDWREKD